MPDIPRSAIESAIHAENQAAAKRPEQKSLREDLQALWSTFKETPAGHGVMAHTRATRQYLRCRSGHRARRHRRGAA